MAEAKAAAAFSTLMSFGGPATAVLGGVVAGLLGKDGPDAPRLEQSRTISEMDMGDYGKYVEAQIASQSRAMQATIAEGARRAEAINQNIRETQQASNLKMVQEQLGRERDALKRSQEAELQAKTPARQTSQKAPTYMHVDVTEQLAPALISRVMTAPASPVAVTPSTVATQPQATSAGLIGYLPLIIGGALILSMVLTAKKGKS